MKFSALITFLIIASFVWGGIILIVSTAVRREGEKMRHAAAARTADRPTES